VARSNDAINLRGDAPTTALTIIGTIRSTQGRFGPPFFFRFAARRFISAERSSRVMLAQAAAPSLP